MPRAIFRSPEDLWSGVLLASSGIAFALASLAYDRGSVTRMGPGFFPFVLAAALALIGIGSVLRSALRSGPPVVAFAVRPTVLVLGATVVFAALLQGAGLAAALLVVVPVSALASMRFRWTSALLLAGAVSAASSLVFVYGLGVPVPVLGPWLAG